LQERDLIEEGCSFCSQQYCFDAVDVGRVFRQTNQTPPASTVVQ